MRFRILGPVRVEADGHEVVITAGRDRVLLGALLLHANQPQTVDQLIDVVWPDRPPRDARNQLQGCVSRLRKRLAGLGRVIVTEPDGYRAVVDAGDLDLLEFRRLIAAARADVAEGRYEEAATVYRAGLALWRGPALAGIDGHAVPRAAATLDEERVQALEERLAAELSAGAGGELVAELTELVGSYPMRERLHRGLMLALYRAGRQADALATYRRARELLQDELGVEPGTELQELHRAILNRDRAIDGASTVPAQPAGPVPRQLPSDVAGFSGRTGPLKALDELLARRSETTGPVVISAIAGTAGIGKTALAVHWAHGVADRFPDGQLYVNLRGFDPAGTPVEPATAIRGFLDGLAVPPERVPTEFDAQVNLYRSLLADRQILIVLDNARDPDQVRPLLPGAAGCLVLVTSRSQLSGLLATDSAVPLPLDLLPDDEARQLLAARLGTDRMTAEPEAVADVIAVCAGLPLALAVVAARAAARPDFPLSATADQIRAAGAGLDPWTGADPASDLRTVFSWSYNALDSTAARLFRLLGLHPGPDFAVPAAASLAALPLPQTRYHLTQLIEANLLIEQVPGRYALHDLLRTYAIERAMVIETERDRHAALYRLLDHYLQTAYAATLLLDPHRPPPHTPPAPQGGVARIELRTHEEATEWLTMEEAGLIKAIEYAAASDFDTHAWQLANCLNVFFDRRGMLAQLLGIQRTGLGAAQRLGDRVAEGMAHTAIGVALSALRSHDAAKEHLNRALALRNELGDLRGQAMSHVNLAWLSYRQADWEGALQNSRRAYDLFRKVDDRAWQGRALNMVAWCYAVRGEYQQAIACCEHALAIQQEVGDVTEEGFTWDSLGYAQLHLGDPRLAITSFHRALALFDRQDDRRGRASVLHHLGDAHYAVDERDIARSVWLDALRLFQQVGRHEAREVQAKLDRLASEA
jgi:DNA-binding SARP family transcriptional activator